MKTKILLLAFLVVLASCHKDRDIITEEDNPDPPVILITTKLVSQTDTSFEATRHATQFFAGESNSFSSFPFMINRGNQINRDFELITLTTEEHHQFYQVHPLIENDVNYLHWRIPGLQFYQGHSASDAHISINNEFALEIPAGSLQYKDGSLFSESYTLVYSFIDPTSTYADAIPSYLGYDERNQLKAMDFEDCFYVTVKSEAGEELQFTSSARIVFSNATSSDPWYFDDTVSSWRSDTSSINETHLNLGRSTYYALAEAHPSTRMSGILRINDRLTPHHLIKITCKGVARHIYTTNKGAFAIYLSSGQEITIDVLLPCGSAYSTTLTVPDNADFEYPLLIQDPTCTNSVFTGTLRNQQGSEASDGFLLLDDTPGYLYTGKAGFNFPIPICSSHYLGVQGLDLATGETGPVIQWESADSVHLYSVFACEQSKMEYLSLTVSGDTKMYWDLKTSVNGQSRVVIEEGLTETELDLEIFISGMTDREYNDEELNIRFEDEQLGQQGYSLYCPTSTSGCGFSKFIITHFPETQGEWIRGYFEGEFWIKTFHPLTAAYKPVRGEFQVYRDF